MLLVPLTTTDHRKGSLATRWLSASGFPPDIARLLASNEATMNAAPLLAIPGHQVPLKGGSTASPTDLWVLARTRRGLVSIVVDDADSKPIGPTVGEWQATATPGTDRWAALCGLLEVSAACEPSIRYRLFHPTAAALIEARRFFAIGAAVIVQAFDTSRSSFGDFQQFVALMGGRVSRAGELVPVTPREGIELYFGWTQG